MDWVYHEVAYLGVRVHWTHHELLSLDHAERRRWVEVVRAQQPRVTAEGGFSV